MIKKKKEKKKRKEKDHHCHSRARRVLPIIVSGRAGWRAAFGHWFSDSLLAGRICQSGLADGRPRFDYPLLLLRGPVNRLRISIRCAPILSTRPLNVSRSNSFERNRVISRGNTASARPFNRPFPGKLLEN